eukprot:TRINITY_DN26670_c0_g1_i1.p1 TRINITY_DN26670_c0_g1~~TRINITY_DN26670_c0_g1_i1.p1  ORF type:complete len:188 (-),score=11.41 TRINITY_DN26670_c0_g1_i1:55-618(-)
MLQKMKTGLLAFCFLVTLVQCSGLNCQVGPCSWYEDCLESLYQCGSGGYPIGYGFYFCDRFSDAMDSFTDLGQEWISNTRLCLQQTLKDELGLPFNPAQISCDQVRSDAFDTHAACYTQGYPSVCDIPEDWPRLFTVVHSGLFSAEGFKQIGQVIKACASETSEMEQNKQKFLESIRQDPRYLDIDM